MRLRSAVQRARACSRSRSSSCASSGGAVIAAWNARNMRRRDSGHTLAAIGMRASAGANSPASAERENARTIVCATGDSSRLRLCSANDFGANPTDAWNGSSATTISLFAFMSRNERSGASNAIASRFSMLNPARAWKSTGCTCNDSGTRAEITLNRNGNTGPNSLDPREPTMYSGWAAITSVSATGAPPGCSINEGDCGCPLNHISASGERHCSPVRWNMDCRHSPEPHA